MADEKLTLDLEVRGVAAAMQSLGAVSSAVAGIGAGGGISGIGGGLAAATRLGAFTSALGVAAVAVSALAVATKGAAEALANFGRLQTGLGATTAETALLRVIGGALGISDIRGMAGRMQTALSSGLGAAMAARLGVGPQVELGQGINLGQIAVRVIEDIRAARTQEEALGRARIAGVEELAEVWSMTRHEYEQMREEARELSRSFTPQRIREAREFNQELDRFSRNIERIKIGAASAVLPGANRFLEDLRAESQGGDRLKNRTDWLQENARAAKAQNHSLEKNTDAANRLADELRQTNGIFGGGGRARAAIPAQFGPGGGFALSKALRSHAVRLGAHAISM